MQFWSVWVVCKYFNCSTLSKDLLLNFYRDFLLATIYLDFLAFTSIAISVLKRWKKGKVHPRTVDEGRERELSYSCTLSLTSALNVGECLTSRPGRFCTGKGTRYAFYKRLGEPQDRSGRQGNSCPPPGFVSRTAQSVANRYTDHEIPAPISIQASEKTSACFCSYNMYAFIQYINIVSLKKKALYHSFYSNLFF